MTKLVYVMHCLVLSASKENFA